MTRFLAGTLGILATTGAATVLACSSAGSSATGAGDAGQDVTSSADAASEAAAEAGEDAGVGADSGEDAAPDASAQDAAALFPYALLRIANWSANAPGIDVCTSIHGGSNFSGPLVANLLADDDGGTLTSDGTPGLPFPLVTSYVTVAPGAYDIRVVAAGSTTCSAPVLPDTAVSSSFARGAAWTVALLGNAASGDAGPTPMTVATFADEVDDERGAPLRLRFINAAPSMSLAELDTGTFATMSASPLFPAVPYGLASSFIEADAEVPGVDDNGYCRTTNLLNTQLNLLAAGGMTDGIVTMPVSTVAGTPVTIVALSGATASAAGLLLECLDSAASGGPLSECRVLP